jgi:glucans biosynthesis protein
MSKGSLIEMPRSTQQRQRRWLPSRRLALGAAVGALAMPLLGSGAHAQASDFISQVREALGEGKSFSQGAVVELARQIAKKPFSAPRSDLPDGFRNLTVDQYQAIRFRKSDRIWSGEGRGFVIEPLARGFVYTNPVALFLVEDDAVRRVAYDPARFDFGRTPAPAPSDLGFSGMRILLQGRDDAEPREVASFQGASFFRGLAKGQVPGAMARGLTLRPADARGEEFPLFRAFWIERPAAMTDSIVVHGLLDSESVCGAYRFTIRARDETIIDVEGTIFARATLDHVGLAGIAGMYLFGAASHRIDDDARPAVHDVGGLQLRTGSREWIWRPLTNPESLQISAFVDQNPKGFGLLQRNRDYGAFQDDDHAYERCPSVWIEAIGDWGQGDTQLLEIPSTNETNANILSYWRPRDQVAQGGQSSFAYRQYWAWNAPDRPDLATIAATHTGHGSASGRRRFVVDFTSPRFVDDASIAGLAAAPSTSPGVIATTRVIPHLDRKALRVIFELDPKNETLCELRLVLMQGGKAASETWLYRWTS